MKKSALFLLTLFYSFTLLLSSATPTFAACGTINVTGGTCSISGGVTCGTSNPLACCSPASDCSTAPPPASADFCAVLPPGMSLQTCQAISKLFENQTDGPWYSQNPSQFSKKVLDPTNESDIFGERYTYAQINWIINSIATMLNPAANIHTATDFFDFITAIEKVIKDAVSGQLPTIQDYAKLGPAGLFAGGISALYSNPPASGIGEIKYMATRLFDLGTGVQPAYAQSGGYGFSGLGGNSGSAVRALWTASRNMAYLVMVILLVASGFLIMFRVKINPQTVVSLQTMIPKLIITMLLVTFSFAIAGFVIDLVYVIIVAFIGMLGLNQLTTNLPGTINITTNIPFALYAAVQTLPTLFFSLLIVGIFSIALAGFTAGGSLLLGAVIIAIIFIYFLIILWKILWMLIKAYVMIVLQIVIAPLQIMLDLVPGQQGFGPWLRNLIANASVFAVVPIMFLLQNILSGNIFLNNMLGLKSFWDLGGINLSLPYMGGSGEISVLISLGTGFVIFSLTPKIADMIRDALKIPAFKYGAAFGEATMPFREGAGTGASYVGTQIGIRSGLMIPDPSKPGVFIPAGRLGKGYSDFVDSLSGKIRRG